MLYSVNNSEVAGDSTNAMWWAKFCMQTKFYFPKADLHWSLSHSVNANWPMMKNQDHYLQNGWDVFIR